MTGSDAGLVTPPSADGGGHGPGWGVVATVKAPLPQVMAFLAHHLALGAAQIWLCFDDPDDPAFAAVKDIPRVSAQLCDATWWSKIGQRPERHQNRQARNAQRIWRGCGLAWLAHIDVDEFILPRTTVAEVLAQAHPDQVLLRLEPYEAMHDPSLPDDIFTARQFRAALKPRYARLRPAVLGRFAATLPEGMLSHSAGKGFFRTKIPGLSPRLHGAFINGERLPGPPFDPGIALLHFHAQDRAAWQRALPFRLTRGAYQYHPELQILLAAASAAEIDAFYRETQCLTAPKAELLQTAGRLITADLQLRHAIAKLETTYDHP